MSLSTPVFHILLSLADGDRHGYAIIQEIAERTAGDVRLTASTLYAAVKRLLDAEWIEERSTPPAGAKEDSRRRYYRLTPLGLEAARTEAARIEGLAAAARAKGLLARAPSATGRA